METIKRKQIYRPQKDLLWKINHEAEENFNKADKILSLQNKSMS